MVTAELTKAKIKAIGRNAILSKFRFSPTFIAIETKEVNEAMLFIAKFNRLTDKIASKLTIDFLHYEAERIGGEISNWFVTSTKDGEIQLRFYIRPKKVKK